MTSWLATSRRSFIASISITTLMRACGIFIGRFANRSAGAATQTTSNSAAALGHSDLASFTRALALHRGNVAAQFAMVLGESRSASRASDDLHLFARLWKDPSTVAPTSLAHAGFSDPAALLVALQRARSG